MGEARDGGAIQTCEERGKPDVPAAGTSGDNRPAWCVVRRAGVCAGYYLVLAAVHRHGAEPVRRARAVSGKAGWDAAWYSLQAPVPDGRS